VSRPLRILHLEDSVADAALVLAILEQEGLAVEALRVDSRDAFVQALRGCALDVILSDNTLPAFDGLTALALAHEHCPDVPFIFVSGTLGEEVAIESLKRGAADYILKERPARLVAAITRAVEGSKARAERRRIEEALREAQERLRGIYESSKDAIGYVALDGRLQDVNGAFVRLTGRSREELLGTPYPELAAPDHRSVTADTWARVLQTGNPAEHDMDLLHRDGARVPISLTIFAVMDQDGRPVGMAMICKDMTERKQLEAQLRQAQKMEAIGRLAGGIAHDFNNLLTIINGYSDLLLLSLPAEQVWRGPLEEIKKAGMRAAALTQQLLAFSRKQPISPTVLDLNEVVEDSVKMLARLLGPSIELDVDLVPGPARIKADRDQLAQVLMNLTVNARDAMPEGGRVRIATADVVLGEAEAARMPDARPGAYVLLTFSDSGCGMDEACRARIFEPFFTTKEPGKGTGLGLATVYGIVKQSGGAIAVESAPGQGTTFRVFLPPTLERREAAQSAARTQDLPRGHETILLADDEPGIRALIAHTLSAAGYRVLEAGDGEAAFDLAGRWEGPIHLLLTDVAMPKLDGGRLAARLIPLQPEMKVLFMTGYTDSPLVLQRTVQPDMPLLQKPFMPERLIRLIREVLDRQVPPRRTTD
jgi:hypothetical protein